MRIEPTGDRDTVSRDTNASPTAARDRIMISIEPNGDVNAEEQRHDRDDTGHRPAEVLPHQDGAVMGRFSRRHFLHRAIATGALMDLPFLGRAHAAPLFNVVIVFVPGTIELLP